MPAKLMIAGTRGGRAIRSFLILGALTCAIVLGPLLSAQVTATHDSTPVAVIDGTMKVSAGQTVFLDGTFSSDPGGGTLSFLWTLEARPEGSIATITDSTDAHAKFIADVAGIYRVKLVVNNGFNNSEPVYGAVTVTP